MAGSWKLIFTSDRYTTTILGVLNNAPLVKVHDILQVVDIEKKTAYNKVCRNLQPLTVRLNEHSI